MKSIVHTLKKYTFFIFFTAFFAAMLCFPSPVFRGASQGLLLWFDSVLPTLFPFIFISTFLVLSGTFVFISRFTAPLLSRLFHISGYGAFAVLTGFLCGYPMGSKVAADLYRKKYISRAESQYLLSFCNNTSPMFIMSFVVLQNLKQEKLMLPSMIILFLSPVFCSFLFRKFYQNPPVFHGSSSLSSDRSISFAQSLDHAVSDALEAIVKVGGYIILFCVITELLDTFLSGAFLLKTIILPGLEISNGIAAICRMALVFPLKYIGCMALTSFGGWCAAAQTMSMLADTGIPIFPYIIQKLVTAAVTSLLTFLYLCFFY